MQTASSSPENRRFVWAGYLLGFALGGFFDGIILHQILQWHHLLVGLKGAPFDDLRFQVMADGLFHAFMYAVAALGLWLLWSTRRKAAALSSDRLLPAAVLIGFGFWHVLDAMFSHWLLGIHRVRMDVPNPLAWDIGWLVPFGLAPLAGGIAMRRLARHRISVEHGRVQNLSIVLAGCTVAAGYVAGFPAELTRQATTVTVVLRPDVAPATFLAALADSESRVLWTDRAGGVWVLAGDSVISPWQLYRTGALYVSGSFLPAGCASWLRTLR